jgi:hypothetical protein
VLPITDAHSFILATTSIVSGSHNDAFELKDHLRSAFKFIKWLGISIVGSYFNADSAFDTKAARWTCFNHKVIPNILTNKRLFNPEVYKLRFTSERTFAWIDKFRALLVRFDLTARQHTSWAHITSCLPSSTSVTYWLSKSLNEFVQKYQNFTLNTME